MFDFELEGQVALVTGAASGLGARFARVLAEQGASVVCCARRADRLEALLAEIRAAGGRGMTLPLDVTDEAAQTAALDAIEAELGPVSVLVNCAGIAGSTSARRESRETWDAVLAVNVTAPLLLSQAVAQRLIATGGSGAIVNVSSVLASAANQDAAYSASKGAVEQLTRSLALDLAPYGIRVNALAPGYFDSELTDLMGKGSYRAALTHTIPLGRFGDPRELDAALLMLASPRSSFMTGSVVTVDGGHTCQVPGSVKYLQQRS